MRRAFLVCGLGFGDEGKGATVDWLVHQYNAALVIRYNGGSQAGHNVVTPDGRHHCFQQFGAGTFHPGVRTHLSRFMLINPINMMREEEHLREVGVTDAWQRTSVDPRALIITPFHRALNRRMVLKAGGPSNSCGHGVGVCRQFHIDYGDSVLFAGDLLDETKVFMKLKFIKDKCEELASDLPEDPNIRWPEDPIGMCWNWYGDWRERVDFRETKEVLKHPSTVAFEGAQGVLLDENNGTPGFNTWTNTTFHNADLLLNESGSLYSRVRVGVIRTYYTRHGAGPFPTEDPNLSYPEPHNEDTCFQGQFRRGTFDSRLFREAIKICGGVDVLAINHFDCPSSFILPMEVRPLRVIRGYGPTYEDRTL